MPGNEPIKVRLWHVRDTANARVYSALPQSRNPESADLHVIPAQAQLVAPFMSKISASITIGLLNDGHIKFDDYEVEPLTNKWKVDE